jgi:hypothetical protein
VHDWLDALDRAGAVEDAYNYILAVLSAPSYTQTHWQALENDFLRVPLTADSVVFDEAAALGQRLREAWELRVPRDPSVSWKGAPSPRPLGKAVHSDSRLVFGNGRELEGVTANAWRFEMSNYPVLRAWFAARQHWHPTVNQAKEAIAVVSALLAMIGMQPELDATLARVVRSAP